LVSLGLGVGFTLLGLVGLPSSVDGIVTWLGYINLTLLVFNLIPALPLDGGRVLRSALWYFKHDLARATRVAADVGQGFAYLFIALGIAMLIFQGTFSGAWLAFVGWFLLQAARAEARYIATEEALEGLRVRDLMVRDPVTVDPISRSGSSWTTSRGHAASRPIRWSTTAARSGCSLSARSPRFLAQSGTRDACATR